MDNSTAIEEGNSTAVGEAISLANKIAPMSKRKRRDLTPAEKERAARLDALWEAYQQENPHMSQEAAALEMGWTTQGAVSQYVRGRIPLNMPAAYRFARLFGVSITEIEPEWADTTPSRTAHQPAAASPKAAKDSIDVPVMDVHGSMGKGILVPDHDTVLGSMRLTMRFIRMNLPAISRPGALRITTGHGDSMYPTFRDGVPLIVDTGITSIQTDAVYMFIRDDELFIKRLQRLDGGAIKIISDNRQLYDPETLSREQVERLIILARVLFAWRGERL